MRWLIPILIVDALLIAYLFTGGAEEKRADLVFASSSEHNSLDPQQLSWSHDIRIVENLFEPLVKIKIPELTPEPGVAESWTISEDGKTYTFKLRKDAKWSNGDLVKASDFVYAWRRALLPDLAADYTQLLWVIKGAEAFFNWRTAELETYAKLPAKEKSEERAAALMKKTYAHFSETVGLATPDDFTLVVTLERPVPYLLELAAFITWVPVHANTCDAQTLMDPESGRLIQDPYWTRPAESATDEKPALVCNGPYVLQRRRFRRDLLLVANKQFRDYALMGNKSVLEVIVPDGQAQYLMFTRGEVDWIPSFTGGQMGPELLRQKIALERLKEFRMPFTGEAIAAELPSRDFVHPVPSAGTYYYMFNCNEKLIDGTPNPLHDPRVRLALSLAIDRDRIVNAVTRLGQPVAATFVPVGSLPNYDAPKEAGVLFDPARARKVLAEAGYPGGKGIKGLTIIYNTGSEHENTAQSIAYTWKHELGIDVPIKGVETTALGDAHKKQDYSIARAGWNGDYLDPTTFLDKFLKDNGNNDSKYNNPKFESLMKEAATQLDPKKRMALLREAETIMLQDAAIAPIYQSVTIDLYDSAKVKNMHLNPWGFRRTENVVVDRGEKK
ncbi:MAG: peptide ABC transporter substrate-binding protein [Phycisphaeraceae bacterium]